MKTTMSERYSVLGDANSPITIKGLIEALDASVTGGANPDAIVMAYDPDEDTMVPVTGYLYRPVLTGHPDEIHLQTDLH